MRSWRWRLRARVSSGEGHSSTAEKQDSSEDTLSSTTYATPRVASSCVLAAGEKVDLNFPGRQLDHFCTATPKWKRLIAQVKREHCAGIAGRRVFFAAIALQIR